MTRRLVLPALAALLAAVGPIARPSETASAVAPTPGHEVSATTGLPSRVPATAAQALSASFPVPSGALYVATNGSDSNPGTQGQPFATLEKATHSVHPGATIVVRGGTYRQGVKDPATGSYPQGTQWMTWLPSSVTIQNYPGEQVWFDGTDVATGWTKSGVYWTKAWSTPTFCANQYYSRPYSSQTAAGPCSHADVIGGQNANGDPQMLFRNGVELAEVTSLAALTSSTFYYDQAARKMYVGFDPSTATVELTKRAQALALYKPNRLTIKGIGFRRYGTNEYTNATSGAVALNGGEGVTLERVAITRNAGGGLLSWHSRDLSLRDSYIGDNGFTGFLGDGSYGARKADASARDDVLIEYSRFDDNNTEGFGVTCQASCGSAGVKFTGMIGFTARYSSFSHNGGARGSGFWCDMACEEGKIYGNTVVGNDRHGIVYEISNSGTIASNIIADNGWHSPDSNGLMVGSANTRMYNNTIVNNSANNVLIYDDARSGGDGVGPDSVKDDFVNNIVVGGRSGRPQIDVRGGTASRVGNTTASQIVGTFSHNSYHRAPGTARWWFLWEERFNQISLYDAPADLQTAHRAEYASTVSNAIADPFFIAAGTDFRVRAGSAAKGTGAALPADIAAMLDQPSGVAVNRGVLHLGAAPTTAPPTPALLARDSFGRNVAAGWGSAEQGGSWSGNNAAALSVESGHGSARISAGSSVAASLDGVSSTSTDLTLTASVDKLPVAGTGIYLNGIARRAVDQGDYRAKVIVVPGGLVHIGLIRTDSMGRETTIAAPIPVSGLKIGAGTKLRLRVQALGSGTTMIQAKVWLAAGAEPPGWQRSATDSTARLQTAGSVGILAYLSRSTSNGPVTLSLDDLAAVRL